MKFLKNLTWKKLIISVSAILVLVIITVLLFKERPPIKPEDLSAGDYSYAIEYSDYQIKTAMKKHKIPGVVFAMLDGGNVIFSNAYGYADVENKIETTPDTIFKIGSISKVFTGIEVMKMQEEGLIDINMPLVDYLPEFEINSRFSETGPITVSSLLTHRSGLPRGGTILLWDWSTRPLVLDAQMKSLKDSYMVYPVGYRYKYSNIGYNTLARMIERVRGLEPPAENTAGAFPYYMQENFFNPLGMPDTSFGSNNLMYGVPSDNPKAMGYYRKKGHNIPFNQFDIISMASGNVHTTLNDMITFTASLLAPDDEGIITERLLGSMYYHQEDNTRDLKDNGLTWFRNSEVLGETVVFHDGTNQGFISMLALIPEHDIGMVIIANSDEFENVKSILSFDILRVMLESKTGKSIPKPPDSDIASIPEAVLQGYTGRYLMNDEFIDVILKNSKLKARYKGFGLTLKPIGDNRFKFKNPLGDEFESRISFFPGNDFEEPYMILEMGDAFFCPRYPVPDEIPESWKDLEGQYTKHARHPSEYSDSNILGVAEIAIKKGVLMMSDSFALLPVDGNRILIQGGVFHGETMEYDPDTGEIIWRFSIYKPDLT